MSVNHRRMRYVRWSYLLVGLLALTGSGCLAVAAGTAVVAGGVAAGAYLTGAVPRDYRAGFPETFAATKLALTDLGLPITKEKTDQDTAIFESISGSNQNVVINLKTRLSEVPADGPITTVEVRVGPLGDRTVTERFGAQSPEKPLSERLLAQIGGRLATLPKTVALPPVGLAPSPGVVPSGNWTVPGAPLALQQTGPPPLAPPGSLAPVAVTPTK